MLDSFGMIKQHQYSLGTTGVIYPLVFDEMRIWFASNPGFSSFPSLVIFSLVCSIFGSSFYLLLDQSRSSRVILIQRLLARIKIGLGGEGLTREAHNLMEEVGKCHH